MSLFVSLGVSVFVASLFGFLAKLFRQPVLVGYLFAGILLGGLGFFQTGYNFVFDSFAQIGITLLLFLVGLGMNVVEFRKLGFVIFATALAQIVFTTVFGFLIAFFIGFSFIPSLYIAIALTFSSTVIIVKLLSEKHDLGSLHGRIALGVLLVQDLVAVLILVFLGGFQNISHTLSYFDFILVFLRGLGLLAAVYVLSQHLLPRILDRIAAVSSELLFVVSVSWALLVASVVSLPQVGFSIEIGGFLAGLALSTSVERFQISSRIKPLRDFFVTLFFVILGSSLLQGLTFGVFWQSIAFSLFVLIVNPIIVLVILWLLGYKSRTSFLAAITFGQVSEFSFIVVAMGNRVGHIEPGVVSLISLVAVFTMVSSTYLILHGERIYKIVSPYLKVFEPTVSRESAYVVQAEFKDHIVLVGADRAGRVILPALKKIGSSIVVVDFNPSVVERLQAEGVTATYGDVSDFDVLELLNLSSSRLVVSTINNLEDNLSILEKIKTGDHRPVSVFTADSARSAIALYEAGASYVVVPNVAGGEHIAHTFRVHGLSGDIFKRLGERHFNRIVREKLKT